MFNISLKYFLFILFTAVLVTFQSCNSEEDIQKEIKIRLSKQLEDNIKGNTNTYNLRASESVIGFYEKTNFEPLWINDSALNKNGVELLTLLKNAKQYGLWPTYYQVSNIEKFALDSLFQAELLLSNGFYLFTTHLNSGLLDKTKDTIIFNDLKNELNFNHSDLLTRIKNGDSLVEVVLSVQPQEWEYQQLQKGLSHYVSSYTLDTISTLIPSIKKDSAKCYNAAKQALIHNGFLNENQSSDDSIFIEQLKAFQLLNGLKDDAVVGKWTGRMLAKSNLDRFYQAALSLEKWRWKSYDTIPERYVWVNLPAYTLKLYDKRQLVRQHRVVVGAYGTQTPEFQSKMKRLVTNPFWYVPYSISSTEILRGIKKDSTYLKRRGYKLFRDGAEVNSKNVNWTEVGETNFRYNVRQNGGGGNSLGRVKFLFPNKHAVYIHDTPSKSLFWNDVRAYSHGCVRLHEPNLLAQAILNIDENKVEGDSISGMMKRGVKKIIELNTPIDVYIEYYTATGDSLGQIKFYPDMYGRDKEYISILKKNAK